MAYISIYVATLPLPNNILNLLQEWKFTMHRPVAIINVHSLKYIYSFIEEFIALLRSMEKVVHPTKTLVSLTQTLWYFDVALFTHHDQSCGKQLSKSAWSTRLSITGNIRRVNNALCSSNKQKIETPSPKFFLPSKETKQKVKAVKQGSKYLWHNIYM